MLLTRYVLGDQFQDRFSGRIEKFAHGFQRDDFSYIILLRVVPAPFFVVNVAAALFGARWRQFVAGTFIGAIPATILYANLGAGLAELAAAGVQPTLADLTRPSFLIMIAMAALLALSPLAYRAWLKRSDV